MSSPRLKRAGPADENGEVPAPLNADSIRRAPKVLLHDHLDGGLRPQTVLELADEAGYRDLPVHDADELGHWFRQTADSGSLVRYLETFAHTVAVMQRPEAVSRVARECALDLAADGVVYAEVRMAPELLTEGGTPIEEAVEAILDGFAKGSAEAAGQGTPITIGTLLCAMRQNDRWDEVAGLVVRHRDAGVVGFDLAGPEVGFPPDRIPSAIGMLVGAGAHRTVHAGEAAGVDSIRAALDGARAERLGHGVRVADEVAEDGALGPVARRGTARAPSGSGTACASPTRSPRTAPSARWRSGSSTRRCRWRSRRRPTCRPAPTRPWPRTRSAGCTGSASR